MNAAQTEKALAMRQARSWAEGLGEIDDQVGERFSPSELRKRALTYLHGLLSPVERKNGWQVADEAGDETPNATQHPLGPAVWSADEIRNDLREYVVKYLGDDDGVLVIDETGFFDEGDQERRRAAAAFRNGRSCRELPYRGLPGLRDPPGASIFRPRALSATGMGRGQRANGRRETSAESRVRHKTGPGPADDRAGAARWRAILLGDLGCGLRE